MNTVFSSICKLIVTTFIPGLELRASVPVGFFVGDILNTLGIAGVVTVCFLANVVVGMIVFEMMGFVERVLRKIDFFEKRIWPHLEKRREKLRPMIEKYGVWGVAVFIGVPLPGTGAYTGAVGAYLLKLDRRKFWLANFVGVAIAALAVTAICLLIQQGFVGEDSWIIKIIIK